MSRGFFVLSLTPLAAIEVSHLLGISRASLSLRGRHWFLTGVIGAVLNTKVFDMPRGIFIQSLKFLAGF